MTNDAPRYGAETGLVKIILIPVVEFGINLVPPAGPARGAGNLFHRVEAEGQQDGLLQPLMHAPVIAVFCRNAHRTAIQQGQRGFDRVTRFGGGLTG